MKFIKPLIFIATITLSACQSEDKPTNISPSQTVADISLRATSDITTPSPVMAASFVPNSVASWLGHIILLDEKGTLHRATTNSTKTEVVALGKYTDLMGLAREKQSGVFLALTSQGQIKAFVQSDNEGNYTHMAVSQNNHEFKRFCASTEPSSSRIWAETANGAGVYSIDIFGDTSLSLNEAEPLSDETNLCEVNNALTLAIDYKLKVDNESPYLTLSNNQKDLSVEITNGLSIGGINTAGFVTVTNANMGSVFNEGVILVADKDNGRLVLISLAYALKEIRTH